MSWLGDLLGGGASTVAGAVGTLAKDVRQAITGELPAELRVKQDELMAQSDAGQVELVKQDIITGGLFQAGWRPFIGWTCAIGFFFEFIGQPIMAWGSLNWGWIPPPKVGTGDLIVMATGMLGLGFYRTYEKTKGRG